MKTFKTLLALGLLAMGLPALAQNSSEAFPLAVAYNLNGEAAVANKVVNAQQLIDSTTLTLTGSQPDVCRLIDITVTDADSSITAGVLTVTGTDCWGDPLVSTFTFAAGGSGVKSLVVTSGKASGAYYKTITSAVTGVLTGEGALDTVSVGYSVGDVGYQYPAFGVRVDRGNFRTVDPHATLPIAIPVKNNATNSLVAVTAGTKPFNNIVVGDLLLFDIAGVQYSRVVTVRTDADNVTMDSVLALPTAGQTFRYKKFYISSDPVDGWFGVSGYGSVAFIVDVQANTDTGGITGRASCKGEDLGTRRYPNFDAATFNVASTATGTNVVNFDLKLLPYAFCRIGIKFGTNDDNDTGTENIYVSLLARR